LPAQARHPETPGPIARWSLLNQLDISSKGWYLDFDNLFNQTPSDAYVAWRFARPCSGSPIRRRRALCSLMITSKCASGPSRRGPLAVGADRQLSLVISAAAGCAEHPIRWAVTARTSRVCFAPAKSPPGGEKRSSPLFKNTSSKQFVTPALSPTFSLPTSIRSSAGVSKGGAVFGRSPKTPGSRNARAHQLPKADDPDPMKIFDRKPRRVLCRH